MQVSHRPQICSKIQKKKENSKINQNDHSAVYKWVKTDEFLRGGGNPFHLKFLWKKILNTRLYTVIIQGSYKNYSAAHQVNYFSCFLGQKKIKLPTQLIFVIFLPVKCRYCVLT